METIKYGVKTRYEKRLHRLGLKLVHRMCDRACTGSSWSRPCDSRDYENCDDCVCNHCDDCPCIPESRFLNKNKSRDRRGFRAGETAYLTVPVNGHRKCRVIAFLKGDIVVHTEGGDEFVVFEEQLVRENPDSASSAEGNPGAF